MWVLGAGRIPRNSEWTTQSSKELYGFLEEGIKINVIVQESIRVQAMFSYYILSK